MPFDYNAAIWGKNEATLKISNPGNVRLRRALKAFSDSTDGAKILEIGCGAGAFIRAIKRNRPELLCYGVDISAKAIEIAKQHIDGVDYRVGTVRSVFSDGEFNGIAIIDVLEHVADPGGLIRDALALLKPGGILYAFVPCERDATSLWNLLDKMGLKKGLTAKYAGHINFFTRRELAGLIKSNGFEILNISYGEHFLGQILGAGVFFSMDARAKKFGASQMNNEIFFAESPPNHFFAFLKRTVNSLVSIESMIFSSLPSPNMHIIARKL